MKHTTVAELGATLYMPATRDDAIEAITGRSIPGLKSLVLCLEDAVREDETERALMQLSRTLRNMTLQGSFSTKVFIRPRNPSMLRGLTRMKGINAVDGFVLPKVTANTIDQWIEPLGNSHYIMPTIETAEAFDMSEMRRLRDKLSVMRDIVLAVRIGGNDLLSCLGARRSKTRTIYDGPLGPLISSLVGTFAPAGFSLTSPVLERYNDLDLLREEVERDLEHGIIAKTAIHPKQISVIHESYTVDEEDYEDALSILKADAPAVFGSHGAMCEPQTHRVWAARILERAQHYGVHQATSLRSVA